MNAYIAAQKRSWEAWFCNNGEIVHSDPERLKEAIKWLSRCFGAGLEEEELKDIGHCYSTLIVANCIRHNVPVPISNKEFVREVKFGIEYIKMLRAEVERQLPEEIARSR